MSSSKERVAYVVEHLNMAADGNVTTRAMMGEYVVYYRDTVLGGIYDDRLLIKPTASARSLLPDAPLETPYPGAKEMLRVDDVEDREFLRKLLLAMYPELPERKVRKKKADNGV